MMAFTVEFSRRALDNIKALRKRDQQIVVDAIDAQLLHEPEKPTRNRKRLEDNSLAPWELRVGAIRVFYDVDASEKRVAVIAVGKKTHNTLWIGDEEINL